MPADHSTPDTREAALREAVARCAAAWWRHAVERPKFDALGDGPRDASMEMASMLATLSVPPTDAAVFAVFEKELVAMLLARRPRCVVVDYNPDGTLANTALAAGLPARRFPWKTCMWLDWSRGEVKVRHGYGAPVQTIHPALTHALEATP